MPSKEEPDSDGDGRPKSPEIDQQVPDTESATAVPGQTEATGAPQVTADRHDFPIVGIGASAGGLAAFEEFFAHLPSTSDSGTAFVLVQHLDPGHKSMLTDLVARYTEMQVFEVEDGMQVQSNCVYIIPPNRDMALLHGKLHLIEQTTSHGLRLPIDFFFRSLAQDQRERAICIILSGTGSDGTLGLKEIKGMGGMAMVQSPETAAYDGMPRSAIASGVVDYVLPAAEMPAQLVAYLKRAAGPQALATFRNAVPEHTQTSLAKVLIVLRDQTRHDFSRYKRSTIVRRVERRMALNQIDRLDDYIRFLQQNLAEIDALFRELLIGVTSFFRDPEAFESLKERALIPLLKDPRRSRPFRAWVPGCSTGEEAYSVAILIQEAADELGDQVGVQIFATDIDGHAIDSARSGIYPNGIAANVSPDRLARFFRQEGDAYRIRRTIRDMVVFATQDVIQDAAFSKLDLICCRNLLIYLEPVLQSQLISLFHYSLNPNGILFLGTSESIGDHLDLFEAVDRQNKLFRRKPGATPVEHRLDATRPVVMPAAPAMAGNRKPHIQKLTESLLLDQATPPAVVVDDKGKIVYIHGHTGRFLEPATGEASLNIYQMARPGLRLELMTGIRQAAIKHEVALYTGLRVGSDTGEIHVDLHISPINEPAALRGLILVVFREIPPDDSTDSEERPTPAGDGDDRLAELEHQLKIKEEYLQATVEEFQATNEELQASNEELQSSNEELQSTNEELETSKEESQSMNEELSTLNAELRERIDQAARINDDMNNLLTATGIRTIFLDVKLKIQRFTPKTTDVVNLIDSDVGRPMGDIVTNLVDYDHLVEDARRVLDTLIPYEVTVLTRNDLWYLIRIVPYRTQDNVIDGVVITFVDVSHQMQIEAQLREIAARIQAARDYGEAILSTVREPLLVMDQHLRVKSVNRAFVKAFGLSEDDVTGQYIYDLGSGQWDSPDLRRLLGEVLPAQTSFHDFDLQFETDGRRQHWLLNARELRQGDDKERLVLLAMEEARPGKNLLPAER